jgi:hypothetical protein
MTEPTLFHSGPMVEGGVDADYYRNPDLGTIHRVRRDGTVEYWTSLRWSLTDPYQEWLKHRSEQGRLAV